MIWTSLRWNWANTLPMGAVCALSLIALANASMANKSFTDAALQLRGYDAARAKVVQATGALPSPAGAIAGADICCVN